VFHLRKVSVRTWILEATSGRLYFDQASVRIIMGTWDTSLYSGDFAMDLRATIGAVVRLPFDADRLVDVLCETEPVAANDPRDEDHTTFWLVVADQFAKRGIAADRVRDTALAIIDAGDDIAMLARRGMTPADIRKRRKMLDAIRARVVAPTVEKRRAVLAKPQPLLMAVGDVIAVPTCAGRCINAYYPSKAHDTQYTKDGPRPWEQDGWAAAVIIDCGRAFEFLSWYRPVVIVEARAEKPTLDALLSDLRWRLELAGTCSPSHFKKMELEIIGRLPVDRAKVAAVFPRLRPGISAAVSDISIANRLSASPAGHAPPIRGSGEAAKGRAQHFDGLQAILEDR